MKTQTSLNWLLPPIFILLTLFNLVVACLLLQNVDPAPRLA